MGNAVIGDDDAETWNAAEASAMCGDARSVNAMRMVALARILAAAETAMLVGDGDAAVVNLKQLERYASLAAAELSASSAG